MSLGERCTTHSELRPTNGQYKPLKTTYDLVSDSSQPGGNSEARICSRICWSLLLAEKLRPWSKGGALMDGMPWCDMLETTADTTDAEDSR